MRRIVFAALALLIFAASAQADPLQRTEKHRSGSVVQSSNWSGYIVAADSGRVFRSVSATFVVPATNCALTVEGWQGDNAAFWTGLDGYTSNTVEQDGVGETCADTPHYFAWYEMYPKYAVLSKLPVNPGDVISSRVYYLAGYYDLQVVNYTEHYTFGSFQKCPGDSICQRSSAEVVTEDPNGSVDGGSNLTDFGNVLYTRANASFMGGHSTHFRTDSGWDEGNDAIMVDPVGAAMVTPTALSPLGNAFATPFQLGS